MKLVLFVLSLSVCSVLLFASCSTPSEQQLQQGGRELEREALFSTD